jgi:hypothetical protein
LLGDKKSFDEVSKEERVDNVNLLSWQKKYGGF